MKPIWKWLIGILATLIILIIGLVWYYSNNWKPIVESKLKEVIHSSTDGLYSLQYDDLDLNVALGNVTLRKAALVPDSAIYRQQVAAKKAPNNRYHIQLKALKVKGFSIKDVVMNKKLDISMIEFEEPNIHLISEYHAYNDTIVQAKSKSLYENIKNIFNSINVRDVKIADVKFKYSKLAEGNTSEINLEKVDIKVKDILVDETSLSDSMRFYYTKMIEVNVPGFEYDLPDGFYKVKFDNLRINTEDKNILLTNVVYKPKMSRAAFYKQKNQNVTMADIKMDTLRVEHLNFRELIDNQQTLASKLQIKNGAVNLYSDTRFRKFPVVKIGQSPHQKIMQMKKLLRIDTVFVDNIDLVYTQMSGKTGKEGAISFNKARGTLTNVTNDSLLLKKDKYMRADLSAKIMNAGNLHAKFSFDMLSNSGYHTYVGTLGAMNATAFNRILQPLLNVGLASGNIRKVSFNMEGTDRKNWGTFKFDYDHLKVDLLNKQQDSGKQTGKKVISFLVNQILINDSNPDANEVYHIGKVNYTRVPEHTFFKTMWQSLLAGIKQCAGISPEREAKLMGTAETGKDVVTESKKTIQKTGNFIKGLFKKKEK